MKKNKKVFEELKKQLILSSIEKKKVKRFFIFDITPKLQYTGFGLFTDDMRQKMKLTRNDLMFQVR